MEYETNIKPKQPNEVICGWINKKGDIYGNSEYDGSDNHYLLADAIAESGIVKWNSWENPEGTLENQGWIKFSPYDVIAFVKPSEVTEEQRKSLLTWMECNGIIGINLRGKYYRYHQIQNMELLQLAITISTLCVRS